MNSSQLRSFSINGLFGLKNINIPFDKESVILIAENGSGKTTILNALYYSISCKFHKLSSIDFDNIILEFASGASVEIKKSDLTLFYRRDLFEGISILRGVLPSREMRALRKLARVNPKMLRDRLLEVKDIYPLSSKYSSLLL